MTKIIIGIILILMGISALTGISLLKFLFAIILILIGVKVLSGSKYNWKKERHTSTNENDLNDVVVFSALNKTIKSENFKGGKVVMVFGGGTIDLSEAKSIEKNINIEVVAIFAGGKIIIPKDWKINLRGASIFGGYSNKTENGAGDTTLNIEGISLFGGIEIINKD